MFPDAKLSCFMHQRCVGECFWWSHYWTAFSTNWAPSKEYTNCEEFRFRIHRCCSIIYIAIRAIVALSNERLPNVRLPVAKKLRCIFRRIWLTHWQNCNHFQMLDMNKSFFSDNETITDCRRCGPPFSLFRFNLTLCPIGVLPKR